MRVPVRLTCACLAALAACGGSDPSAPTPAGSPTPKVSITSPELEVHGTGPVVIQAVVEGCTPDTVELRVDGETLAVLVPPFQYTWDTAWAVEGRREVTARASCGGAAGTSAPTFIWVDRSPPRVVARTPETGSAPWVKDPIAITFSEPVDLATARDAVVLRDAAGKAVPAAISASDGGARWTLSPAVAPAAGDTFTVEIGTGVRDLAGLALEPATAAWTFSYGALFEPARRPLAAWGILEAMAPDLAVNAAFEPVAAWHAGTTLFEITVSGSTVTERRELAPWGRRCGVAIRESEVFVADEGWFDPGYQVRLLHPAGAGFDLAAPAVTDGKRLAIDPDVTFAPDGTPVVVWVESESGQPSQLVRAAFLDGGAWSSRGTASLNVDSRRTAYAPSVGRDGQGRPAVAFAEEGSVFLKRWDGSAWTVVGPGPVATGYATDPAVGFDGDQPYVAVAHLSTGAVRVYTLAQGAWTAIPGDPRRSTTQPARRPAIAVSGPGHFVLAWTEGRISEYPIDAGALYASRWNGTEWVELGGALNRGTDHPAYAPAIAVDGPVGAEGDAFPIVLWTERESPAGTNEDWNLRLARANR